MNAVEEPVSRHGAVGLPEVGYLNPTRMAFDEVNS